ncbi:phage holin family protein [Alkalibacterium putridalgicola]|uniref:phage holin family protein n=1 Tax=Alkalibacterium putridalgicola TaxID=426703 RepID=UPI0034CFE83C
MILELNDITHQIHSIYTNGFMQTLISCVFFDIFTEMLKSFKQKETSSSVSLFGIAKHSLVVLLIFVLNVYLPLFGFQVYAQGFTLWMVVTYLISIAENWGALGLPLPDAVEKTLIKLKEHTEDKIHIDADVMKVEEKEKVITKEEE